MPGVVELNGVDWLNRLISSMVFVKTLVSSWLNFQY